MCVHRIKIFMVYSLVNVKIQKITTHGKLFSKLFTSEYFSPLPQSQRCYTLVVYISSLELETLFLKLFKQRSCAYLRHSHAQSNSKICAIWITIYRRSVIYMPNYLYPFFLPSSFSSSLFYTRSKTFL